MRTRAGAKRIGQRLRARRLELGLSQRQVAEPGISYAYISRIESGTRQPSVKALRKLARRLDVSVQWLETGERDFAAELAALVLASNGKPQPDRAVALATSVLRQREAALRANDSA